MRSFRHGKVPFSYLDVDIVQKRKKGLCLFATQFHNSPKLHSDNLHQMAEFFRDQK